MKNFNFYKTPLIVVLIKKSVIIIKHSKTEGTFLLINWFIIRFTLLKYDWLQQIIQPIKNHKKQT